MRKIKFRGKVLKNEPLFGLHKGQWIYGNCCYDELQKDVAIENTESSDIVRVLVDEKTVGQYIGLNDKNGKEIYEGDLVRVLAYNYDEDEIFVIKYDKDLAQFVLDNDNLCITFDNVYPNEVEVVGYIHDNKDLLNS